MACPQIIKDYLLNSKEAEQLISYYLPDTDMSALDKHPFAQISFRDVGIYNFPLPYKPLSEIVDYNSKGVRAVFYRNDLGITKVRLDYKKANSLPTEVIISPLAFYKCLQYDSVLFANKYIGENKKEGSFCYGYEFNSFYAYKDISHIKTEVDRYQAESFGTNTHNVFTLHNLSTNGYRQATYGVEYIFNMDIIDNKTIILYNLYHISEFSMPKSIIDYWDNQ